MSCGEGANIDKRCTYVDGRLSRYTEDISGLEDSVVSSMINATCVVLSMIIMATGPSDKSKLLRIVMSKVKILPDDILKLTLA